MRKKLILCAFALTLLFPLLHAQGVVTTRSHRLADFTDKVTQVVLSGNALVTNALRQEVVAGWTASAFEFCTLEQYEKIKGQDQYYFLVIADAAGISYLNLHKGTFEVISLPLMAAEGGNGRELTYLGGLIKTVQEFTLEAMESEKVAYGMEAWVNKNYSKWGKSKEVLIASDDLPEGFTAEASYNGLRIVDTAEADQAYIDAAGATLVSYTVAPFTTEKGSYCYKMLFDAETHNLCYISKHKISAKKGEGFLPEDLKRLSKKK